VPTTNAAGIALIKEFEGCRLQAYPDPATGGDPWTIGYGHTAGVEPGQTVTQAQADAFLISDLRMFEQQVAALVQVVLTPNQFSALVSFQYNTGALDGSTLLALLNQQQFAAAADQFGRWVYANGQVMPGLVRRRAAEKALFLRA